MGEYLDKLKALSGTEGTTKKSTTGSAYDALLIDTAGSSELRGIQRAQDDLKAAQQRAAQNLQTVTPTVVAQNKRSSPLTAIENRKNRISSASGAAEYAAAIAKTQQDAFQAETGTPYLDYLKAATEYGQIKGKADAIRANGAPSSLATALAADIASGGWKEKSEESDYRTIIEAATAKKNAEEANRKYSERYGVPAESYTGNEFMDAAQYGGAKEAQQERLNRERMASTAQRFSAAAADAAAKVDEKIQPASIAALKTKEDAYRLRYPEQYAARMDGSYNDAEYEDAAQYASREELKKAQDARKAERAAWNEVRLEQLTNTADSSARARIDNESRDKTYKYINDIDGYREKLKKESGALQTGFDFRQKYADLDHMTKAEIATYNKLYAFEGKNTAEEYLDLLRESLQQRAAQKETADIRALADKHPILASAESIAVQGLKPINFIMDVGTMLVGGDIDSNDARHRDALWSNTVRERVAQNLENAFKLELPAIGNAASWAYQATMSAVDSAVSMGLGSMAVGGAAGLAESEANQKFAANFVNFIFSTSVGEEKLIEGIQNGKSQRVALLDAAVSGAIEWASETYGLEQLMKEPAMTVGKVLTAFLTEGSEEIASNFANNIYDALRNGSSSEYAQGMAKYMAQGYGTLQALAQVMEDKLLGEDLSAFLAAGLAGAGMGGARIGQTSIEQGKAYNSAGQRILDNKKQEALMDIVATLPDGSTAKQLAAQYGDKLSALRLGQIYQAAQRDIRSAASQQVRAAASERLLSLGVEEGTAAAVSEIVAKAGTGTATQEELQTFATEIMSNEQSMEAAIEAMSSPAVAEMQSAIESLDEMAKEAQETEKPEAAAQERIDAREAIAEMQDAFTARMDEELKTEGSENGREEGAADSGERDGGMDPGITTGQLGEGAGENSQYDTGAEGTAAPAESGEGEGVPAQGVRYISAYELGIQNGSTNKTLREVSEQEFAKNKEMQQAVQLARNSGSEIVLLHGSIVTKVRGKQMTASGLYEDGVIYINVDSAVGRANQLAAHEVFHRMAAQDPALVPKCAAYMRDTFGEEMMLQLLANYMEAFHGCYGTEEADMQYYYEEMLADAYGSIYVAGRREAGGTLTPALDSFLKKYGSEQGTNRGQAPPESGTRLSPEAETVGDTEDVNGQRFSMEAEVEQSRNLIALHNLTEDKLRKALALGGFPMPSIAVTKADIPHTNFGDISLVMDKSTVDPKVNKKNVVYSADAWTPTFPKIDYEVNPDVQSRISKLYYSLVQKYDNNLIEPLYNYVASLSDMLDRRGGEQGIIDHLRDDTNMMNVYLAATGDPVEKIYSSETIRMDDSDIENYEYLLSVLGKDVFRAMQTHAGETAFSAKRRWVANYSEKFKAAYQAMLIHLGLDEAAVQPAVDAMKGADFWKEAAAVRNFMKNGPVTTKSTYNRAATEERIRDAANNGYVEWLKALFNGVEASRGIYNNKDFYTKNGNRRSFSATHYPVTLDNIAKAMAGQNGGNSKNVSGFYGIKSLRAGTSKIFRSIDQMHKYEGRLQNLSDDQLNEIHNGLSGRLQAITNSLAIISGEQSDIFFADRIGNILMEIAEQKQITDEVIKRTFAYYSLPINNQVAADIHDLLYDVSVMPVNLFEAKPERAVLFDEVRAAIIPDGTAQDVIDGLKQYGVDIKIYDEGDIRQRLDAVNSIPDARFSPEAETVGDVVLEAADAATARMARQGNVAEDEGEADADIRGWDIDERILSVSEMDKMAHDKKVELAAQASRNAVAAQIKRTQRKLDAYKALETDGAMSEAMEKNLASLNDTMDVYRSRMRELNEQRRQEAKEKREAEGFQPTFAKKALHERVLDDFSIPVGQKTQVTVLLDQCAERVLANGTLEQADMDELFKRLFSTGVIMQEANEYFANLFRQMQGMKLSVPLDVVQNIGENWYGLRAQAWGMRLYLTTDPRNTPIATAYDELRSEYGSLPEETDLTAMLMNIVNAMDEGRSKKLTQKQYGRFLARQAGPTEEASYISELMDKLESAMRDFAAEAKAEVRLRERNALDNSKLVVQYEERMKNAARAKKESEDRNRVMADIRRLDRFHGLTAEQSAARDELIGHIDTVARSISAEGIENLLALQQRYTEYKDRMGDDFMPNEYVEKRLSRLTQKQTDTMDLGELIELGRMVNALVTSIENSRRLIGDTRNALIDDAVSECIRELDEAKGAKHGKELHIAGKDIDPSLLYEKLFHNAMLSPRRFFGYISGWADGQFDAIGAELEQGEQKAIAWQQAAWDAFNSFLEKKENREWLKTATGRDAEILTVEVSGEQRVNGLLVPVREVRITPMMRVSIYMASKAQQNLMHIEQGGYYFPNLEKYKSGQIAEAYADASRIMLRPSEVMRIAKTITPQELEFAKLLRTFMDDFSAKAINETSMLLDGFERAHNRNYWPIRSSADFTGTNQDSGLQVDGMLESMGCIANKRIKATNPIYLEDALDVLKRQIDSTGRYYGLAVPLRNLNMLLNRTLHYTGRDYALNLMEQIGHKFRAPAKEYLTNLQVQMNGQIAEKNRGYDKFLNAIRGSYAGATLMFNPSVALSQLSSLPAAAQRIGWSGILHSLDGRRKSEIEAVMNRYSAAYRYRHNGNIDTEMVDVVRSDGWESKVPAVFGWINAMDAMAIRRIWVASEYRVRQDMGIEPGTIDEDGKDPFYVEVAKVFERAVFDTQPNYSTMQRPAVLRTNSSLTKALTMFKTVPLQYYNMAFEAVGRVRAANARYQSNQNSVTKEKLQDAKRFAVRTFSGLFAANLVYVLIKAAFKVFRDKDDYQEDDGSYSAKSVGLGLLDDYAEVTAGSILFAGDLYNLITSRLTGDKWYAPEVSSVENIVSAMENAWNTISTFYDIANGSADFRKGAAALRTAAEDIAQLGFGLPAKNIENYLLATLHWINPEYELELENLFDEVGRKDIDSKGLLGEREALAGVSVVMDNRADVSDGVKRELTRLFLAGYTGVIPSSIPSEFKITVDDATEDVTLDRKGRSAYRKAYRAAIGTALDELMISDAWAAADDADKAKAVARLYAYAAAKAKEESGGYVPDGWVSELDASGIGVGSYLEFYTATLHIDGKDEDGNTVSGLKAMECMETLMDLNLSEADEQGITRAFVLSDNAVEKLDSVLAAGVSWNDAAKLIADGLLDKAASAAEDGVKGGAIATIANAYGSIAPADGKKSVSDKQKLGVLDGAGLSRADQDAAVGGILGTEMETESGGKSQYALYLDSMDAGLNYSEWLAQKNAGTLSGTLAMMDAGASKSGSIAAANAVKGSSGTSEKLAAIYECDLNEKDALAALCCYDKSNADKYRYAVDFQIPAGTLLQLKVETLPAADADGNGSYTQKEVQSAINRIPNLTAYKRGLLWQMLTGATSTKNNPYDKAAGQAYLYEKSTWKEEKNGEAGTVE